MRVLKSSFYNKKKLDRANNKQKDLISYVTLNSKEAYKEIYNSSVGMNVSFSGNVINNNYSEEFKNSVDDFLFYTPGKKEIKPDKYQISAMNGVYKGNNVIPSFPTGSGKTLIAEYAIFNNIKDRKKTFYTTPLKALTFQKYNSFGKMFGKDNVAILTGDYKDDAKKIDKASVVVMTTEIYRNMLWSNFNKPDNKKFSDLGTVVFDETQYMSDRDRGMTWEESIILSPAHVQQILLSATIGNVNQFADWVQNIQPTKEVTAISVPPEERHVPTNFYAVNIAESAEFDRLLTGRVNIRKLTSKYKSAKMPDRVQMALKQLAGVVGKENSVENGLETLEKMANGKDEISMSDLRDRFTGAHIKKDDIESIIPVIVDRKTLSLNEKHITEQQDEAILEAAEEIQENQKKEIEETIEFDFGKPFNLKNGQNLIKLKAGDEIRFGNLDPIIIRKDSFIVYDKQGKVVNIDNKGVKKLKKGNFVKLEDGTKESVKKNIVVNADHDKTIIKLDKSQTYRPVDQGEVLVSAKNKEVQIENGDIVLTYTVNPKKINKRREDRKAKFDNKDNKLSRKEFLQRFDLVIRQANKNNMLPGIVFVFSKKKIDDYMDYFAANGESLFNENDPKDREKLVKLSHYLDEYEKSCSKSTDDFIDYIVSKGDVLPESPKDTEIEELKRRIECIEELEQKNPYSNNIELQDYAEYLSENLNLHFDKTNEKDIKNLKLTLKHRKELMENGILTSKYYDRLTLMKGYSAHHAGMMPSYKLLIEKLFQEKLLKVCFATETLQAGIDMPVKSVFFPSLFKPYKDENGEIDFREVNSNEFHQMIGRAGRRGIDTSGNAIIIYDNEETKQLSGKLSLDKYSDIKSNFNANYGFLLNYLQFQPDFDLMNKLIGKSFLVHDSKEKNKEEVTQNIKNDFDNIKHILEDKGYISARSDGKYNVEEKGKIASCIKGTNQLVLTDLIYGEYLSHLSPAVLAATVSSLATDVTSPLSKDITPHANSAQYASANRYEDKYNKLINISLPEEIAKLGKALFSENVKILNLDYEKGSLDDENNLKSLMKEVDHRLSEFPPEKVLELKAEKELYESELSKRQSIENKTIKIKKDKLEYTAVNKTVKSLNQVFKNADNNSYDLKDISKRTSVAGVGHFLDQIDDYLDKNTSDVYQLENNFELRKIEVEKLLSVQELVLKSEKLDRNLEYISEVIGQNDISKIALKSSFYEISSEFDEDKVKSLKFQLNTILSSHETRFDKAKNLMLNFMKDNKIEKPENIIVPAYKNLYVKNRIDQSKKDKTIKFLSQLKSALKTNDTKVRSGIDNILEINKVLESEDNKDKPLKKALNRSLLQLSRTDDENNILDIDIAMMLNEKADASEDSLQSHVLSSTLSSFEQKRAADEFREFITLDKDVNKYKNEFVLKSKNEIQSKTRLLVETLGLRKNSNLAQSKIEVLKEQLLESDKPEDKKALNLIKSIEAKKQNLKELELYNNEMKKSKDEICKIENLKFSKKVLIKTKVEFDKFLGDKEDLKSKLKNVNNDFNTAKSLLYIYQQASKVRELQKKKGNIEGLLELEKSKDAGKIELLGSISDIERVVVDNLKAQQKYEIPVSTSSITFDTEVPITILNWANASRENSAKSWNEIYNASAGRDSIKHEGDLFRAINSTVELLKQVESASKSSHFNSKDKAKSMKILKQNSKKAIEMLKKPPIGELPKGIEIKE